MEVNLTDCPNCRRLEEERAQAVESVMAQERPIQAALINERDVLKARLAQAEAKAFDWQEQWKIISSRLAQAEAANTAHIARIQHLSAEVARYMAGHDIGEQRIREAEAREAAMRGALKAAHIRMAHDEDCAGFLYHHDQPPAGYQTKCPKCLTLAALSPSPAAPRR